MRDGLRTTDLDGLAGWVKSHGAAAELVLTYSQAKALLESLRQLQQGGILLRKQNKKLRLRIALLKEAAGVTGDADPDDLESDERDQT